MRTPPAPTFIDLFSGCGGITRGFIDAGFQLIAGYESAPAAAATYAANFGSASTVFGDLTLVTDVPPADVVVGGPPCQGFSNLGKRDPEDGRNKLWDAYVDFVVASGCRVFVFENVERFARSAEYHLLVSEANGGRLEGWTIRGLTLNAADFGVPQRRTRSIIIGTRDLEVPGPRHSHAEVPAPEQKPWRTLRDTISHLEFQLEPATLCRRFFELDEDTRVLGPFKFDEIHIGRTYWDLSLARYSCIAPGENRHKLPPDLQMDCWRRHKTGAHDVLGRLEWDKPALTIRTEFFKPEKGRYLHPEWSATDEQVNRALSHAEAALIQGFTDNHVWCGSKVEIARQIGNAVPPPMARAVGEAIISVL